MSDTQNSVAGPSIRPLPRWVSIAFTATVVANFIVRAKGAPPAWMTYPPLLLPLAALLLTDLCLFVLPYEVGRRYRGAP